MLDTLQKMSGTTHKTFKDQKTITTDMERLFWRTDGKISETVSVKEVPTITYNDMAFIPMCNSIVFRAGDSPIWNRNQMCLPMSWRLHQGTISKPGKKYTLQTIPTLSSAIDFDVRQNQPNFMKMWEKRRDQAIIAPTVVKAYNTAYGYDEDKVARLDPDMYADEIMEIVRDECAKAEAAKAAAKKAGRQVDEPEEQYEENKDFTQAQAENEAIYESWTAPRYAGKTLSKSSLCSAPDSPQVNHGLDDYIVKAFIENRAAFAQDSEHFNLRSDGLYGADGKPYLIQTTSDEEAEAMRKAASEIDSRVYTEEALKMTSEMKGYEVTDAFYRFLLSQGSWDGFASGKFEKAMARLLSDGE